MKLVWSPQLALNAYIDTVKTCKDFQESDAAEMISAMTGGWNPRLIVQAWSSGSEITTSIGLEIAACHLGARYVCIVQNERCRTEYTSTMRDHGARLPELVVGEAKEVMPKLSAVEFMVVDGWRNDLNELFGLVKLSHRGAVLMCKNAMQKCMVGFLWNSVIGEKERLTRSVIIPVGQGLKIAYLKNDIDREYGKSSSRKDSRWITKIDQKTGEEHIYRR